MPFPVRCRNWLLDGTAVHHGDMPAGWREIHDEPSEPIRGIQHVLFWKDYRQLGGVPGRAYERDYVAGEFWSEEDPDETAFVGTSRVRVWFVDLFEDATSERGYIRMRKRPCPEACQYTATLRTP